MGRFFSFLLAAASCLQLFAQEAEEDITVDYNNPQKYIIGGVSVEGNKYINSDQILKISGLQPGFEVNVPGEEFSAVVNRLWLQKYFEDRGVHKVRTYRERGKDVVLAFKDKNGKPYRYAIYGGNAYAEIYCPDRGKNAGKWQIEIIPNYCAHQKGFVPQWRHTNAHAKLIMRLHIDDMVAYEKDGKTVIARVKKMSGKLVYFRENKIAKEDGNKLSWAASAEQLRLHNGRKITVTIDGRVIDPKRPKGKTDGSDC